VQGTYGAARCDAAGAPHGADHGCHPHYAYARSDRRTRPHLIGGRSGRPAHTPRKPGADDGGTHAVHGFFSGRSHLNSSRIAEHFTTRLHRACLPDLGKQTGDAVAGAGVRWRRAATAARRHRWVIDAIVVRSRPHVIISTRVAGLIDPGSLSGAAAEKVGHLSPEHGCSRQGSSGWAADDRGIVRRNGAGSEEKALPNMTVRR